MRKEEVRKALASWHSAGVYGIGADPPRRLGVRTLSIQPGSPSKNGYLEPFNAKLRDELLDGEIFYTREEAKIPIERWRQHHHRSPPYSALGYRPPGPKVIEPSHPG